MDGVSTDFAFEQASLPVCLFLHLRAFTGFWAIKHRRGLNLSPSNSEAEIGGRSWRIVPEGESVTEQRPLWKEKEDANREKDKEMKRKTCKLGRGQRGRERDVMTAIHLRQSCNLITICLATDIFWNHLEQKPTTIKPILCYLAVLHVATCSYA